MFRLAIRGKHVDYVSLLTIVVLSLALGVLLAIAFWPRPNIRELVTTIHKQGQQIEIVSGLYADEKGKVEEMKARAFCDDNRPSVI
jgi:hypothetical protein